MRIILQKPARVICWGIGADFKKIWPQLEREVSEGQLCIVACVDEKTKKNGKINIIPPHYINKYEYDYIIICSSRFYNDIYKEILNKGIEASKIIHGNLLLEKGFNFFEYQAAGWLNNQIINNSFTDVTYEDKPKSFLGKNVEVLMGRKSYIGKICFEDGGIHSFLKMTIGNYTSISHNISVEIGLNLDHDYRRVMNYGISHFAGNENFIEEVLKKKHFLEIGSDVWIGSGTRIKSGIHIGDGSVVAANSYVVSDVPEYAIVGGNPAKLIKYRFDEHIITSLKEVQWWNMPEIELLRYRSLFDDPIKFLEALRQGVVPD